MSTPELKQLKQDSKKACNKAQQLVSDTTKCISDIDAELKRR